jgi:hypothetical protein
MKTLSACLGIGEEIFIFYKYYTAYVLIKQCQQSGYKCFCTLKQHLYYAKNIFLETPSHNRHPPTKINH